MEVDHNQFFNSSTEFSVEQKRLKATCPLSVRRRNFHPEFTRLHKIA